MTEFEDGLVEGTFLCILSFRGGVGVGEDLSILFEDFCGSDNEAGDCFRGAGGDGVDDWIW